MQTRVILAIVALTVFSSCIFTFHPLYSDDVLADVPGLEGSFVERGELFGFNASDSTVWTYVRTQKGVYELEIVDKNKTGTMIVHAVQLGGEYFLDFMVDEVDSDCIPDFLLFHLVPMHSFAKVSITEKQLQMWFIDAEWARDNLNKHRIRIRHETRTDDSDETEMILLTADTEDLQKFATKYARYDEAFADPDIFQRMIAR